VNDALYGSLDENHRILQSDEETRDNNMLHTEPRAARLLETMMFAAAR